MDTYALFRLCHAIDRGFQGTISELAHCPESKAFGKLSGILLDRDDLRAWNAAEEATKVWKQNTSWRHRVKAIAAQIRAEAGFTHPEEMLKKVDPFLRLVDPLLGMGITLAELPDQTGTLKAITAGDETGEYRPNRPHLSLFVKLAPQLFPGVSFDKSEESAPLVLAATLERMAELSPKALEPVADMSAEIDREEQVTLKALEPAQPPLDFAAIVQEAIQQIEANRRIPPNPQNTNSSGSEEDDYANEVCEKLKGQALMIFKYLLTKKHPVNFDSLLEESTIPWRKGNATSPAGISKALKTLQRELNDLGVDFELVIMRSPVERVSLKRLNGAQRKDPIGS